MIKKMCLVLLCIAQFASAGNPPKDGMSFCPVPVAQNQSPYSVQTNEEDFGCCTECCVPFIVVVIVGVVKGLLSHQKSE